jgi:hypothetical protein
MTYKFDLEQDFEREPLRNGFGDAFISFILGEDAEAQLLILMTVRFVCKEDGIYDIRFGIEEINVAKNNESSGLDYSIEWSRRYAPEGVRPAVLATLLDAISCILVKINPRKVTMQSFYKALPDKALDKYRKISDLMVAHGFEVKEEFPDGNHGVRYWLYRRLLTSC